MEDQRCKACGLEICDSYYWIVEGVHGKETWCAECHADEREGILDKIVWKDEEEEE